ncbi:MAG: glucose-6-phosphate dehydrogenase assembly protein OpcA [Actinomycetota bacterium]|nr:glucose-6-phosphate dehydrogenase assembly protein OpcA [Actinomycetota bacterium]
MSPAEDLWSEHDTTPDAIEAALRELLVKRHGANQALAPARVLNLVVIVDRDWKGEISNRLARVGRYHASRTVLCAVGDGRETIDARVVMSYEEPSGASLGVIQEQVELDLGPEHLDALETIVDPLIVSDLPTVLWSPHGHEQAVQALLEMIDVMLLDSDDALAAPEALARASALLGEAYVVDLAWLRTTPWRERLAASFDPPERATALQGISGIEVRYRPSSAASAVLLAGWLSSRLGWETQALASRGGDGEDEGGDGDGCGGGGLRGEGLPGSGRLRGYAWRGGERVGIELKATDQDAPGLGGITVDCASGFSLSLDRARGGLRAKECSPAGHERAWQILGASRGEGGILGEGVRQALLRDPTYGPALGAARELWPE